MYRVILAVGVTMVAAQNPYDSIETRSVAYPQKSNSLGSIYSSGLGSSQGYRDAIYEDNNVTPTPSLAPIYRNPGNQIVYRKPTGSQGVRVANGQRGNVRGQTAFGPQQAELEELEEEKEEPDRLSLLLPQSKFDCVGKQTGYYADEDLNCEVFHYCQDNAKHSWICPEGFTFHQVHLICMPPSGEKDINCKKSSQYHFVNEYLYKPLNLAEAESKPNVTVRYSERYFPGEIFTDERDSHYYHSNNAPLQQRRPVQQVYLSQSQSTTINSLPSGARPSPNPYHLSSINQVFRSPEEVNIPLQQRRPQTQQQQQTLRRLPQVRPDEEDYE